MHLNEFSLVLIKPDATERELELEILSGLKAKGLCVVKFGTIQFDVQLVLDFYQWEKLDYPEEIKGYICATPLPIWIVSGEGAISKTMSLKNELRVKHCKGPLKNLFHCPTSWEESQWQFDLIKNKSIPMKPRTKNQVEAIIFKILATGEILFLMLKRNPKKGGFWQPVTGNVEEGEAFEAAAVREVEEETGITEIIQLIDPDYSYEFRDNELDQFERIFGIQVREDQEIRLSSEHTEYQWATQEDALNKFLKYPGNKEGLRRLHQKLISEGGQK